MRVTLLHRHGTIMQISKISGLKYESRHITQDGPSCFDTKIYYRYCFYSSNHETRGIEIRKEDMCQIIKKHKELHS